MVKISSKIMSLVKKVADKLREFGATIAVAESCTGGLLSAALTEFDGASNYFMGGVVLYSERSKVDFGIPQSLIDKEGTVSQEVATFMSRLTRVRFAADIGVGITGIAGESIEGKDRGLVYITVTREGGVIIQREFRFDGDRDKIREQAIENALLMVMESLMADKLLGEGEDLVSKDRDVPLRLFVAVKMPQEFVDWWRASRRSLDFAGVKLVEPENIHITLKFIGSVKKDKVGEVVDSIQDVVKDFKQFSVKTGEIVMFPNEKIVRVVALGVKDGEKELSNLAASLEEALEKIGYPKAAHGFKAHITLARVKNKRAQSLILARKHHLFEELPDVEFLVDKIYLVKSTLTPRGPVYEDLYEFALNKE